MKCGTVLYVHCNPRIPYYRMMCMCMYEFGYGFKLCKCTSILFTFIIIIISLLRILVEVSPSEGVLPAYLQEVVRVTLRPSQCSHYNCSISYELVTDKSASE